MEWRAEHRRFAIYIGLLAALLSYFACRLIPPLEATDYALSDFIFFELKEKRLPTPQIVIIEIDERTIKEKGLDRKNHVELIRKLSAARPKVIAFDVLFSEPDDADEDLAEEMRRAGNVTLATTLLEESLSKRPIPKEVVKKGALASRRRHYRLHSQGDAVVPVEPLAKAAAAIGFVNFYPDSDSKVRWVPLIVECKGNAYIYFGLAVLALAQGVNPSSIELSEDGVKVGKLFLPTETTTAFFIDYPDFQRQIRETEGGWVESRSFSFRRVSYVDVLSGKEKPETFKDKIVLVGATAEGLKDLRPTPLTPFSAGVEIHACMIDTAIQKSFLRGASDFAEIGWAAVWGLFIGGLVPLVRPLWGVVVALIALLLSFKTSFLAFNLRGIMFSIFPHALGILLAYGSVFAYLFFTEERARRRLFDSLSLYVSQNLASELVRTHTDLLAELSAGGRKDISVLFCDIRGFTAVSARLPPFQVAELLNRCFSVMSELIHLYGGEVNKFIGDGLMATFGAMVSRQDHAERAVLCALHMLQEMDEVLWEWRKITGEDLNFGIGINSGDAIVGNFGSKNRMQLDVIGTTVNIAQRLEQMTKTYGAKLLISEATYFATQRLIQARLIPAVPIAGLDEPINVYEVLSVSEFGEQVKWTYQVA